MAALSDAASFRALLSTPAAKWLGTTAAVGAGVLLLRLLRQRQQEVASGFCGLPDTSVPESLHCLAHGEHRQRVLSARAITAIMQGEAQVLEEFLDDAQRKNPEFGGRRADGRSLIRVVLADLAAGPASESLDPHGDTEALLDLLLQSTAYDPEWDDTDDWNETVLLAAGLLRDEGAGAQLAAAEARLLASQAAALAQGAEALQAQALALAAKAAVLLRRLAGEKAAASADLAESAETPGMLSVNTRVKCPVCLVMQEQMLRCTQCHNVGYCSAKHLLEDAPRHSAWCVPVQPEGK